MNTCYIVCALYTKLDFTPDESDLVIAADKGYLTLVENNIRTDAVIGDFDSYTGKIECENIVTYPKEKDDTDSALAIEYAVSEGYKKICVYGAIGGMIDHTLANVALIAKYTGMGIKISFIYGETVIFGLCNSSVRFDKRAEGRISVFSFCDISYGVSETGLYYSLDKAELKNTVPLGVSNEFVGKESEISVENGTLIIITSKKNYERFSTFSDKA
ncbi:MAG: thiamine diphosphokinase [Eubacteriales bacterium]